MNMLNGAFGMKQLNGNGRLPRESVRSGGQGERVPEGACADDRNRRILSREYAFRGKGGYFNATRCAEDPVSKELPFRDAYSFTGQLVNRCVELGAALDDLPLEEYLKFSDLFGSDVYKALSLTENAPK